MDSGLTAGIYISGELSPLIDAEPVPIPVQHNTRAI